MGTQGNNPSLQQLPLAPPQKPSTSHSMENPTSSTTPPNLGRNFRFRKVHKHSAGNLLRVPAQTTLPSPENKEQTVEVSCASDSSPIGLWNKVMMMFHLTFSPSSSACYSLTPSASPWMTPTLSAAPKFVAHYNTNNTSSFNSYLGPFFCPPSGSSCFLSIYLPSSHHLYFKLLIQYLSSNNFKLQLSVMEE